MPTLHSVTVSAPHLKNLNVIALPSIHTLYCSGGEQIYFGTII
jgi:hypothetical protein